jgi:hypothetical protein
MMDDDGGQLIVRAVREELPLLGEAPALQTLVDKDTRGQGEGEYKRASTSQRHHS